MQSSYFETFSHPEGPQWDNNWDALGAPPSLQDPTPFNNQGFWPSMRDPVQPYPGEPLLTTQMPAYFGAVPQLQTESLPSFSHTGLSSNGFSSSSYPLPALSNVPSGPPIQEAPPIPTAGGEISGSLHPVQHSREEYSQNPDLFINSMVPNPTDPTLRLVLRNDILPSEWWCENKKEPPNALDIFTDKLPVKPRQFECRFCGKKNRRPDRATDHTRVHIDHRPYRCEGTEGCGGADCTSRFLTKADLKSHCTKYEEDCSHCGKTVEKKNMKRHHQSKACGRNQLPT